MFYINEILTQNYCLKTNSSSGIDEGESEWRLLEALARENSLKLRLQKLMASIQHVIYKKFLMKVFYYEKILIYIHFFIFSGWKS